ncbi:hypothetical protein [Arthrobacter sp. MDT1-65]
MQGQSDAQWSDPGARSVVDEDADDGLDAFLPMLSHADPILHVQAR